MKKQNKSTSQSPILRQKAEELLNTSASPSVRKTGQHFDLSKAGMQKLIHELEVHQIELELQNEELMLAKSIAQDISEKYTELYDFAPLGYFTLSKEGEILNLNLCGSQMLGKSRFELKNRHLGFFLTKDSKPVLILFLEKVFSSNTKQSCELSLASDSGLPICIHITGIAAENGKHCFLTMVDITERKQMEEALLNTREMFEKAQKLAHIGIWEWNTDVDHVTWTEELYNIAGLNPTLPAPTFTGQSACYTGPSWQLLKTAVEKAMKTGEQYQLELELTRPDGTIRNVNAFGGAKYDNDGKFTGLYGTLQDISKRKNAEKMLEDLIEKNPMSIQIVDKEGFTLKINPAHTMLFGSVPPSDFSIFDDLQDKQPELEKLLLRAKNGEVVHLPDIYYNVNDSLHELPDVPVWISAVIFPLKDNDGKPEKFVIIHENITKRKRVEKELCESENKFRAIFEKNSAALAIIESDTTISLVNEAFCQMSGYTEQEAIGKSWTLLISTEDLERLKEYNRRRLINPNDAPGKYEFSFYHKNGEIKHAMLSIAMILDDIKIITSFIDITDRKRAENELRKNEERFRHISSTISDISYSCVSDQEGNYSIDWMTGAAEQITGYSIAEIKAKKCWKNLVVDEDLVHFKQYVTSLAPGSSGNCEIRMRQKNGGIVWVNSFAECIKGQGQPEPHILYGGLVDITERKKAEENLRRANIFLDSIVENIPNMIFLKDAKELRFIRFNKAGEDILGIPKEEILGKNDYDFFSKEQSDFFTENDREVLRNKKMIDITEEPILTRHQGVRIIHTKKVPILNALGEPEYLLGISEDITERKQAENEILKFNRDLDLRVKQRTAELEVVNNELETFSYSISHDLKAPLRHIIGFIDLFLDKKSTQLSKEELGYLEVISSSASEMERLIDAILSFSKLNRSELQNTTIQSSTLVQKVINFFEPEMQNRKITFNVESLPDVIGDEELIRQVWTNLISNAIKYTGKIAEAVIDIGSISTGTGKIFFITDNGAGFKMKYAEKLFGVFQRMHKSSDFEGVGIGLANVKRIITRHGGSCWAKGEPDKGATFYFSLPK